MAIIGAFDVTKHFDELDEPLDSPEGMLSPSVRRGRVVANIFGGSADAGVTFTGPVGTGETPAGQITLDTAETTVVDGDYLGLIEFKASAEASGTDAVLRAAMIHAEADGTFSSSLNATDLVFSLGVSEAATEKMRLKSNGVLSVGGMQQSVVIVADATPYTVLAADSGKVHIVADQTSSITMTLPAAAAGLQYEFLYGGGADEAANWVIVPTAGFYIGSVSHIDQDGNTSNSVYSNGSSNDTLTIIKPEGGTVVRVFSNGTNWYLTGIVHSITAPTIAD